MNESKIVNSLSSYFRSDLKVPSKYYALMDRIESMQKDLIEQYKGSNKSRKEFKKKLEMILKDYEEVTSIEIDRYFLFGFSLAVQIMSEAFNVEIK